MASKDNVYFDEENRLIFISSDIDESSIGIVSYDILHLISIDNKNEKTNTHYEREPIKLYINSMGGSVYDMWGLIDIIINSKTPIHTYCTGYAMSATFLIFIAGHKRFTTKHSTFMCHQIWNRMSGKYQDLVQDMKEKDYLQKCLEQFVLEKTHMSKKCLKDIREKKMDYYIHGEDAIDLGIADVLIEEGE